MLSSEDYSFTWDKMTWYREEICNLFAICTIPSPNLVVIRETLEGMRNTQHKGLKLRNEKFDQPLHAVCLAYSEGGGSLELIKHMIELYPESIMSRNGDGYLPINCACKGNAPLEVIKYLIEKDTSTIKDHRGTFTRTPLQWACIQGASLEVIQHLVEQWPESIRYANRSRPFDYPLHCACENGAKPGVIQYLVEKWWVALAITTETYGRLPLHKACMAVTPLQLQDIQCMVERYPDALQQKDTENEATPLNCACGTGVTSVGVIPYLVEQWPESVKIPDINGLLPLHNACWGTSRYYTHDRESGFESRTTLDDIQILVQQWPESVRHPFVRKMGDGKSPRLTTKRDFKKMSIRTRPIYIAWHTREPDDDDLINWLDLPWRRASRRSFVRPPETRRRLHIYLTDGHMLR